jgi:hypothetical protein
MPWKQVEWRYSCTIIDLGTKWEWVSMNICLTKIKIDHLVHWLFGWAPDNQKRWHHKSVCPCERMLSLIKAFQFCAFTVKEEVLHRDVQCLNLYTLNKIHVYCKVMRIQTSLKKCLQALRILVSIIVLWHSSVLIKKGSEAFKMNEWMLIYQTG